MHRLVLFILTVFTATVLLAVDPPNDAIFETIKVTQAQTAAFRIEQAANGSYKLVERNGTDVVGNEACIPAGGRPNISIDNATTSAWTVRFVPPSAGCHSARCSQNLTELQAVGLCDRSTDNTLCITSAAPLSRCIGPECDAFKAGCMHAGGPQNRTCSMKIADILSACEKNRCGIKLDLPAKTVQGANQKIVYGRETTTTNETWQSVAFPPTSLGQEPYSFTIERTGGTEVLNLEVKELTAGACLPFVREDTTIDRSAVVPLDSTGVASWRYLNPRNPACLDCQNKGIPALAFVNRTGDRAFTVSIELPAEVLRFASGDKCVPGKPCKVSRTAQPNVPAVFEASLLQAIPKETLLKFQVEFFDEAEKVPNPFAYLRLSPALPAEPKSDLQSAFIATIGGALDPFIKAAPETFTDLPVKDKYGNEIAPADGIDDVTKYVPCYLPFTKEGEPALCAGRRLYEGKYARHYSGAARIELSRALGNRAEFNATVNYRTSDFGVDDGNVVKLAEYGVSVFGLNGLSLRFGRTTWANPTSGLAILEKGDGYRFVYKNFSLAHIIKRESDKAPANHDNDDNRSFVGQMKGLPIKLGQTRFLGGLKFADVTAVYGEDKTSHVYRTFGGEIFYVYTNLGCGRTRNGVIAEECVQPHKIGEPRKNWGTISGSVAAFQSSKHASTTKVTPQHGEGWVGLMTTTWTPTTRIREGVTEAVTSYTLHLGKGSSDDPATTTREDYIGEGGSFSPNSMLMSTFLGKVDSKGHVFIGPSLANKTLIGLQVGWNTWSPLKLLADALGVGDTNTASTTLRARQYKFGRPVYTTTDDRNAVREYSVDFAVEVPKGVKVTIGGAYMQTGKGLAPVIADDAWVITSSISLRI